MRKGFGLLILGMTLVSGIPAQAADTVPDRIEAARQAYGKGDSPRAVRELQAALIELQERLGRSLSQQLPPPPSGWKAETAETEGLGQVGGGIAVSRAYTKADASLNASLILDSPAVTSAAALLANHAAIAAQPNLKRVKVGGEDALLRWDGPSRSGEVTLVLGDRVLLEIVGDNLSSGDLLLEVARGWNLAGIRKAVGP